MSNQPSPPLASKDRVLMDILAVVEQRQNLCAFSTAALSLLILYSLGHSDSSRALMAWCAGVALLGLYKLLLASSADVLRRTRRPKVRVALLLASASGSGLLWSVPILIVDPSNPFEVATAVLIVSGIITGSVITYLGMLRFIIPLAFLPCLTMLLALGRSQHHAPVPTMLCIFVFLAFTIALSSKTFHSIYKARTANLHNLQLIAELEAARDELKTLAYRDALTGLPNRRLLDELFPLYASDVFRNGKKLAVLFVDMNAFKQINDTHGHEVGDQVLVEAGKIMKSAVRGNDIVARIGGDEFAVVLKDIDTPADAGSVTRVLHNDLNTSLAIGDLCVPISASVGMALYPDHSDRLEELLRLSDSAMYTDKAAQPARRCQGVT